MACRFARAGWFIGIADIDHPGMAATAALMPAGKSSIHPLDVRDRAAVEALPAALPPEFAAVDVLVNNAGLALGLEPAQRASLDDWQTMIDTNCTGLVQVTRALLPGMVERNRGHVFNLGSVAGSWPYAGGNVYGATKAAVRLAPPLGSTNRKPVCGDSAQSRAVCDG